MLRQNERELVPVCGVPREEHGALHGPVWSCPSPTDRWLQPIYRLLLTLLTASGVHVMPQDAIVDR